MTLILAANLTDRIILAADSKITKINNGKREVVGYCLKLFQYNNRSLEGKIVEKREDLGNFISCMYAGSKDFIFYIHQKLSVAFEQGELSADINVLQSQVYDFFKKITPEYNGRKKGLIIFAGVSLGGAKKIFSFKRLSEIVGPDAFRLEDANVVGAMQFASSKSDFAPLMNQQTGAFVPDQRVFSFEIDEENSIFGVGKVGGTYSIVAGGSTIINNELEKKVLRHFLDKRDITKEGSDIVNFIRNNFSDTIGGAVVLGSIDVKGALTHIFYNIDRSGKVSDRNWSVEIDDNNIWAIDPLGKKIDLIQGFFNGHGSSDWCL